MAEIESLSHSAICVHDLKEAEDFYCDVLGGRQNTRVNFNTDDALRGRSINSSIILEDYLLALVVARDFMPMPPPDQHRGAHGFRHAFHVSRDRFEGTLERLKGRGIAFEGPVDHPANGPFGQSIYFKDPSGNFLEILWRRDERRSRRKPTVVDVG
ncbi:MAG: VOC family protein [Candidatus Binatia bacterium]